MHKISLRLGHEYDRRVVMWFYYDQPYKLRMGFDAPKQSFWIESFRCLR